MNTPTAAPLTPEEQERIRLVLGTVKALVDRWQARYLSARDDTVEPGSSLAADNRLTEPFPISQVAYNYLGVGTDCLSTLLRASVSYGDDGTPSMVTSPHGLFPNLRTAPEVACTAAWLLGSPDRLGRVRARLILHTQEMRDETAALDAMVEDMLARGRTPATSSLAEEGKRWADQWALQRAAELGVPRMGSKHWPSSGAIVEAGAGLAGFGGKHGALLWRSLSGATHGAWWATSLLSRELVRVDSDGPTVEARLTLSPVVFTALLWDVTQILDYGWAMFDRRRACA